MKKRTVVLLILSILVLIESKTYSQVANLEKYNVIWDSPGMNSSGSMPIGNGDIGTNLWVEENGDLVFYLSKTNAWDENGRLCKVGRVRVKFYPALSVKNDFRQELKLRDGIIEIKSTINNQPVTIRFWVDANNPAIQIEAESAIPVNCHAEVELWRLKERLFTKDDDHFSGRGTQNTDYKPTVLPDVITESNSTNIVWYHRNSRSIYELGLKTQHLDNLKDQFPDPLLNLTFGASMSGKGFAKDGNKVLKSVIPAKQHVLSINVLTAKSETPQEWINLLEKVEKKVKKNNPAKALMAHKSWWNSYWERSWVFIDGLPETEIITRGYVLQRFMNACAGRGGSPIKFNGSIFTNEPKPGASPGLTVIDPDWRKWGGNYWFQNTRLAYWPMLATGDFEMMEPWFRMYLDGLKLSKARIKTYYGFDNAAQFPETIYWWGLPNNADYGWNNTKPEPASSYLSHYWNGSLELIAVMLDRYDFTQDLNFAKNTLVPLADPLISFLDQFWQKRDANGKIIFDPAQSLETWHIAVNPLPEIAGLGSLLPRLLDLPKNITTESQRARWSRILQQLPPLPTAEVEGVKLLRPAESFSKKMNSENTELYAIFPYRLFGVGHPELEMARKSFDLRKTRHNKGWCQDGIQAACLGLRDEAAELLAARAARINLDARFPAMWGPNFDWVPDQDHGNNILTSLQFMLIQSVGDKIYVLPAWPKKWNVSFKLHAPKQTIIEGEYRDGKLIRLIVIPKSRMKDVVNMVP